MITTESLRKFYFSSPIIQYVKGVVHAILEHPASAPMLSPAVVLLSEVEARICGNCKFRGSNIEHDSETAYDSEKWEPQVPSTYFLCNLIKGHETMRGVLAPGKIAFSSNASQYNPVLCVENEFGCNMWQRKEAGVEVLKDET